MHVQKAPDLHFRGRTTFRLRFSADWQCKTAKESWDESMVRSWVKDTAADDAALWGLLGDLEDDDRPSTRCLKRAVFSGREEVLVDASEDHMDWIDRKLIPLLLPLVKGRNKGCMGLIAGHHFKHLYSQRVKGQEDDGALIRTTSTAYVCRKLKELSGVTVPYLGEMSAFTVLRFVYDAPNSRDSGVHRSLVRIGHLQHGTGGGSLLGSSMNKLDSTARWVDADFLVRAHDCSRVGGYVDVLGVRPSHSGGAYTLKHRTSAMLNLGSASRGYVLTKGDPSYVEKAMMRPKTMGFGEIAVEIRKASRVEDRQSNWTAEFRVIP